MFVVHSFILGACSILVSVGNFGHTTNFAFRTDEQARLPHFSVVNKIREFIPKQIPGCTLHHLLLLPLCELLDTTLLRTTKWRNLVCIKSVFLEFRSSTVVIQVWDY